MSSKIFVFRIGNLLLGLDLEFVERVERAAEIQSVPAMPEIIPGVVNYHGTLVPVYDLRRKLSLPPGELIPEMLFLIIRTAARKMIIMADAVEGVRDLTPELITTGAAIEKKFEEIIFAKLQDGIIMIYNPEKFLSSGEAILVDELVHSHHSSGAE